MNMSDKLLLKNDHIATISKKEEEEKGNILETPRNINTLFSGPKFKKFFRKAALLFIVICYTAFGALVFQVLEHGQDIIHIEEVKSKLKTDRHNFLSIVRGDSEFNESALLPEDKTCRQLLHQPGGIANSSDLEKALTVYECRLETSIKDGVPASLLNVSEIEPRWTFTKSIFFAATVLTTIGYGDIAPGTDYGRVFCIAFALIGIPLTLSMIADMGELFASCLPIQILKRILPKGRWRTLFSVIGIFGLLLMFIAIGGVFFFLLEEWTFLDAFYFCFITTTTIGFGDLVPAPSSLLLCGVYILVGLALTSTVIEIVRRQYAASFDKMRHLTMRIHQLSIPLAEAMRRMAETGSGEMELDTKLVKELQELNTALTEVQDFEDSEMIPKDDPWQALLDMAEKKKRITVLMYESSV